MDLVKLFWISNLVLWFFLGLAALVLTNKSTLVKRGYSEAYADFLKKDNTKRLIGIAIALPSIELIASFLTLSILQIDNLESQITWITSLSLLILIPIIVADHFATKQKIVQLAKSSKPEIIVDLKYKTINMIFNPFWELTTGMLFLGYALLVIKPIWIAYIHLIIPWLLYLTAKSQLYATKPMLRDSYLGYFAFMMINYALIIYYQARCFVQCFSQLDSLEIYSGYIVTLLLLLKFIIYAFNYPKFKNQLLLK